MGKSEDYRCENDERLLFNQGRDGEISHMHHSQLQLHNKTLLLYKQADITVFRLPMAEWLVYSAIISTGEV